MSKWLLLVNLLIVHEQNYNIIIRSGNESQLLEFQIVCLSHMHYH
jgi:hypothetical protein